MKKQPKKTCKQCGNPVKRDNRTCCSYKCASALKSKKTNRYGFRRCARCKVWKAERMYYWYRTKGRLDPYCRKCKVVINRPKEKKRTEHKQVLRRDSIEFGFFEKCKDIRRRAVKKGLEFNLTPEYLLELWNAQNGKCYFSGMPMTYGIERRGDTVSVDRVVPKHGYTIGNVVLASYTINIMKQDMSIGEFTDRCKSVTQCMEVQ